MDIQFKLPITRFSNFTLLIFKLIIFKIPIICKNEKEVEFRHPRRPTKHPSRYCETLGADKRGSTI